MELKQVQRGMSGKAFLALSFVGLAVLFAIGTLGLRAPTNVVEATFTNLPRYLFEVAVKSAAWFIVTSLMSVITFGLVLDTSLRELWRWFSTPRNDSHAIVLAGIGGVVAIAMLAAQGVTLQQYAFTVMTKGSLGVFLGILVTSVGAWLIGVRSMDDFRMRLVEKDNNSHVLVVMTVLNGAMAFAMLA